MMTEPPLVAVRLRNKDGTYLAASDDKTSVATVCATHTGVGAVSIPKNTEWKVMEHSLTTQYTEYSFRSIHDTELGVQRTGFGSYVVCQQNPNPTQPFLWRIYKIQPCCSWKNLYCMSGCYKLCAAQDGSITVKPGNCDTQLDPGSWWFIDFVATSASEIASTKLALEQHRQYLLQQGNAIFPHPACSTCTHSAASPAPGPSSTRIISGMNHNDSGTQNVGDVTISSNVSGPAVRNSASGIHNSQPPLAPYQVAQRPAVFPPSVHHQASNGPYYGPYPTSMTPQQQQQQQQGAFIPQNYYQSSSSCSNTGPVMGWQQYPGYGAPPTMEQQPNNSASSGAGTYINTGGNSNSSGTQTNNSNIRIGI